MNRTANYAAFYVDEPFSESNLGAYGSYDFCYYQMLKAWKGNDSTFPFVDAHAKTYNVRDDSNWESTLKPRLHTRLSVSKNIILFLSSHTKASRALTEEIDYGMGTLGLPVIVIYPEFQDKSDISDGHNLTPKIVMLWNNLPIFKKLIRNVPTLHIPMKQEIVRKTLNNNNFTIQSKCTSELYI